MAMKSPTQASQMQIQTLTATVEGLSEKGSPLAATAKQRLKETEMLETMLKPKPMHSLTTPEYITHTLRVPPPLHRIRSEPLKEHFLHGAQPKLSASRSQDATDDQDEELVEQTFGSVSPILQAGGRNSFSAVPRTNNLRLKFRKSHTCGSLFAKCNCSSVPLETASPHGRERERERERERDRTAERVINAPALATSPPQLCVSPTSNELSSASSRLTSGVFSLSSQTSNATSAQLSRYESLSASFDYSTSSHDHSPSTAKLASSTPADIVANTNTVQPSTSPVVKVFKLQVPRISSPSSQDSVDGDIVVSASSPASTRKAERNTKSRRLFQSYSHPDTQFIFTDENKHPTVSSATSTQSSKKTLVQVHAPPPDAATVITTRGGKVEIKQQSKRSSSPNIGQYQVLDVAVHPEILVKISPKHSPVPEPRRQQTPVLQALSAQQRRQLLQRSHEVESGGSTSESEYSFDVTSPTESNFGVLKSLQLLPQKSPPVSPLLPVKSALTLNNSLNTPLDESTISAAQKYFAESGILGPVSPSNNLIRKTSQILHDTKVIEQIRKTSMILRANSATNSNRQTPTPTTPSQSPIPFKTAPLKGSNNVNMETPTTQMIYAPTSPKSPHPTAATCGFSPNVPTKSCLVTDDRDAHIKNLQGEIVSLKDVIKSRDAEIGKLRREIHKLKSVLQQTTNHLNIANDDLLQSPPAALAQRSLLPLQSSDISSSHTQQPMCVSCKKKLALELTATASAMPIEHHTAESSNGSSIDSTLSENYQSFSSPTTYAGAPPATCGLAATNEPPAVQNGSTAAIAATGSNDTLSCNGVKSRMYQLAQAPVLKKQGVSGESCETSMQQSINMPIPKFDKDYSSKQLIKEAIMDNDFLKNIDASQVRELVDSMYSLSVAKGEFVVREGEVGAHLYVSAEGEFEVVKNGKVLGIMGPGKAFGELAILYNCTRTASIRVLADARLWVLDRRVFQQIMMRTGMQRIENSVNFLKSVPLLRNLSGEVLAKIADVLEVEFYPAGTYIIRQGASGDTFFLISQGSVQVTQKITPSSEEKEIRTLELGDYFGEQALINEDKRTANIIALAPGVECLTLDRDSFTHLIGDLCELKQKNYGDENRALAMKFAEKKKDIFGSNVKQEFPNLKLTDLEVVATLGIGGFGRVELVKAYQENRVDTFALKCLKKRHIVDTKQEEHVFSERTIMLTCNTPFICRLYRTFRDEKYVYMLLEACMGGEIWTMLRDRGSFDENATQFIIACVLQAFEYLHSRGIIYRDLKPENLMLDERGYVKLVDFGFAKYIGNSSKTWTFCGTPEYVAPEIILNKGHDRAVDYWALGILIHELLSGTPPFTANDPMKTYNFILKGIDMIAFPKHMSRSAVQLIKKLCRDVPAERLGYQKGGIQDIKKHKWFLGFDWDGLESQLLIPPFIRPIAHAADTCYFDKFPCDNSDVPDEFSGWDADF